MAGIIICVIQHSERYDFNKF